MSSRIVPDCTLTTACFLLTKYNESSRNEDDTKKRVDKLFSVPCYLVVYCNQEIYETLRQVREDTYSLGHLTRWVVINLEQTWSYQYVEQIRQNRQVYWPTRDERTSPESHALVCNKFDFVLQTMEQNPFDTSKFGWIDSNIGLDGTKISRNFIQREFLRILDSVSDRFRIQIMGVTNKKYKSPEHKREYYQNYHFIVCGCLFTLGLNGRGREILQRCKQSFVETTNQGYGHGEEMLYLEALDEFYDDIDRAYGDYNDILHNFLSPTINHDYLKRLIIDRYLAYGYHREAYDCCKTILDPIYRRQVSVTPKQHIDFMFNLFVSSYYCRREEAKHVIEMIRKYCDTLPEYQREFDKNRTFYETQFAFCKND